jgi:dihydroflavonol-4-reductase
MPGGISLITGATGHIGNVLVRQLTGAGGYVRALVLPGEDLTPLHRLEVELVEGNLLDYPSLLAAMRQVDTVYHLAGAISILPGRDPNLHLVNVVGTRNVLCAFRQSQARRLVYTSSIHALQRIPHGAVVDESLPYDPDNPYGAYDRSKAQASLLVQQAAQEGLDVVIACPTGVIGPYDYRISEMGKIILDCVRGRPLLYIDGAYDFVDVRDVAQGLVLANQNGRSGENYILSGEQISVRDLIQSVQGAIGKRLVKIKAPRWLGRLAAQLMPHYYRLSGARPRFTPYSLEVLASNSFITSDKARRELGYQPRPLALALADTTRWFGENRALLSF